jgi:hypothetical protein
MMQTDIRYKVCVAGLIEGAASEGPGGSPTSQPPDSVRYEKSATLYSVFNCFS